MKALSLAYLLVMCALGIGSAADWAARAGSIGPALVILLALSVLTALAAIALMPGGGDE